MDRRRILVAHYAGLLKKFSVWLGAISLLVSVGLPQTVMATGQLTSRSVQLSTSSPAASAATTDYVFGFKPSATNTIKAISFEMCTSPIQGVACSQPASGSMSSATFSTGSAGNTSPFTSNWALGGGGNCGAPTSTRACITWTTGNSLASGSPFAVQIGNIQNPTTANYEYYMRVTLWTDANATTPANGTDFGASAVSTGTTVSVDALVQESLVFSVGQTGTCGSLSGNQVYLGSPANAATLNSAVLSSSAASAGSSVLCVNTNAGGGYVLSYTPTSTHNNWFTNKTGATHDFASNATGATITSGTTGGSDFFGMSLKAATPASGDIAGGANVSGGVSPSSYGTGYGTADTFAFSNTANTTLATENTGATGNTLYTVLYEAQSGTTTPFGQYEVNIDYTATSTF
jgi:hypothetical protein